jgi:hypothetical protein
MMNDNQYVKQGRIAGFTFSFIFLLVAAVWAAESKTFDLAAIVFLCLSLVLFLVASFFPKLIAGLFSSLWID